MQGKLAAAHALQQQITKQFGIGPAVDQALLIEEQGSAVGVEAATDMVNRGINTVEEDFGVEPAPAYP